MITIISQLVSSKPMALPVEIPTNYRTPYYKCKPSGATNIDREMSEETADAQKAEYPDMDFLGSGASGLVVDLGPNIVGKYTTFINETVAAKKIQEFKPKCFIEVYDVKQIQNSLWLIVCEKVKVPSHLELSVLYHARMQFATLQYVLQSVHVKPFSSDAQVVEHTYKKFKEWKDNLRQSDFDYSDDHPDNFGWNRNGDLVALDLGGAYKRLDLSK